MDLNDGSPPFNRIGFLDSCPNHPILNRLNVWHECNDTSDTAHRWVITVGLPRTCESRRKAKQGHAQYPPYLDGRE